MKIFNMLNYSRDKLAKDVLRMKNQENSRYTARVEVSLEEEITNQKLQDEMSNSMNHKVFEVTDEDEGF